tara:strand:- start:928 stop:1101 length:174 start_codon:yes stop_codon:yes gene_type:complete
MYDTNTAEFSIDIETRMAVMSDGAIFNKETQEWELDDEDTDDYLQIEEALSKIVRSI